MNSIFGSWKTSLVGLVAGVIILIRSLAGLAGVPVPTFDDNGVPVKDDTGALVMTEPGTFNMDTFMLGLGLIGIGAAARDNDKSSEKVGAA